MVIPGVADTTIGGAAVDVLTMAEPEEQPLLAPVTRSMSWAGVHALSQTQLRRPVGAADVEPITVVRRTATIRRGTRMIKLLSGRQLSSYLHGRLPSGFCYRAVDVADLRPSELAMLTGDASHSDPAGNQVVFALRWRAVDPSDYAIPFSVPVGTLPSYEGLVGISPHDRVGPQVLGTGFAPSSHQLIPEFVTTDLADLPMPAGTSLVAFTPEGTEISLYLYVPEQRAWTRMFGPPTRHLVAGLPEIPPDQEYVQIPNDHIGGSTLVGRFKDELYEALADPPHEYRVLARARAARYPVDTLARRTRYATWRDVVCTVVRADGDWLRLRPCRPDADTAETLGAQCLERGVYEAWATVADVDDVREVDFEYDLSR